MMKNILVLAGGGDNDEAVFATALAAAQPFHAHLEFLHVQIGPGEAAAWEPYSEFLRDQRFEKRYRGCAPRP
jgi:hypothetical protein